MTITAEDLVRREVHYCVSALVSTIANGCYVELRNPSSAYEKDLTALFEAASELTAPILDYEEAATEAGWTKHCEAPFEWYREAKPIDEEIDEETLSDFQGKRVIWRENAQEACEEDKVEPHEWEVFEHWIVSDWLADKLAEHGEKVDKDFFGLTVWARTCTGQGIASDSVIEKITSELNAAR